MTHACIKQPAGSAEAAAMEEGRSAHKDRHKGAAASRPEVGPIKQELERGCEADGVDGDEGRNLDSGYAWLILAVMFLLASSTGGTNRVYGLIYAKQVAIGYYDRESASWPIATASTVENLAGLMTPALAQFLTWRQIELMATGLFVLANVGAYFSDSLLVDILCLGIVQGLALSINTVLSLVINNDYFRRYRTTAYGISLSGSTFGILYLGPIVSWCLERDAGEFRSGYLAIGGVLALNGLLVIFIKPRHKTWRKSAAKNNGTGAGGAGSGAGPAAGRRRSLLERHLERKNSVASIALMCKQMRQSNLQRQPTLRRSIRDRAAPAQPVCSQSAAKAGLHKSLSTSNEFRGPHDGGKQRMGLFSAPQQDGSHYLANVMISLSNGQEKEEAPPGQTAADKKSSSASLFQTNLSQFGDAGSSSNGSDCSSSQSPDSDHDTKNNNTGSGASESRPSINKLAGDINQADQLDDKLAPSRVDKREKQQQQQEEEEEEEALSSRLVGALLRSPYLHCVWIMLSLYYLIARIFIIILVDMAKDNGLSSSESRALLNYWSVGEIVGRIVLCSFVDLQWLSVRACILLTCSSMSVCIALMALLSGSFYLYAVCSALVAALISLEYVLINVLMIEYLGQSRVTSCYSLGSLISSMALLGRPALIGLFRDQLGSYNGLLILLAVLSLAFGLLFGLTEPLLVRYWPKRQLMHRQQLPS